MTIVSLAHFVSLWRGLLSFIIRPSVGFFFTFLTSQIELEFFSDLRKSFCPNIQDEHHGSHLKIIQTTSPAKQYFGLNQWKQQS